MCAFAAPASSAAPWPCCWRATACGWAWCATTRRRRRDGDVRAYALNRPPANCSKLRAWPDAQHATPVRHAHHGDDGGEVRFDAQAQGVPALAWIVDVEALQERLADALRYQPLVEWLDAPQPAALMAICEGKASAARAEFGVRFTPRRTPNAPSPPGSAVKNPMARSPGNGSPPAKSWLCCPWAAPQAPGELGRRGLVSAGGTCGRLLALDGPGFEAALRGQPAAAPGKLTLASERAAWPLKLAQADRWCGPGWVLAGDAAHTVHPLAGQGLNLGLADARELAQALHQREYWRGAGDMKLLRRYERARKADVLAMGAATDGLQQLFAQHAQPWTLLRNWGMTGSDRSGPLKNWVARQAMGRL